MPRLSHEPGTGTTAQPCYGASMVKCNSRLALIATASCALMLGGCSDRGDYPSLARRPAEDVYANARAAQTPAAQPPGVSAGLTSKLAALLATARKAHESFVARQPAATRAVSAASGAAKGTEAWSVASVAVAGLESARSEVGLPLADLDRLEVEASNRVADGADADFKAVRETRAQVEALTTSESDVIDSLLGRLR
ncbi:hypothetical protein GGQ88_000416 [Novosphingobium hassiacum]|uniref:Uncharacterized protein n=1 Tax=Novosphingobium hassiacum TaxID=173676 RepID=A0A7W5ZSH7_9SPHN|nr:hypothetical protein [Novosphingobium hassiacum]